MKHKRQVAWLAAMLAVSGLNAAAQTVTFSDEEFDDSDWTAEMIVNEAGSSAEFTAEQDTSGGNPGAFRRIHHVGQAGSSPREIHVAHLRRGAVYNPREGGRISRISHSYDPQKSRNPDDLGLQVLPIDLSKRYVLPFPERSHLDTRLDSIRPKRSRCERLYSSRRRWTEASEFLRQRTASRIRLCFRQ